MTYLTSTPTVDLYQSPEDCGLDTSNIKEITIPDLHGEPLKAFHLLYSYGVIDFNSYQDLVKICKKNPRPKEAGRFEKSDQWLEKEDITRFNQIIDEIKVRKDVKIRFIGDEMADRGCNDYFTLKLLKKLSDSGQLEIILSNHTLELIQNYENSCLDENERYSYASIHHGFRSMYNMQALINQGLISAEEVESLVNSVYSKSLKLLSYTLDKKDEIESIYSHAPIGITQIKNLAQALNVPGHEAIPANGKLVLEGDRVISRRGGNIRKVFRTLAPHLKDELKKETFKRTRVLTTAQKTALKAVIDGINQKLLAAIRNKGLMQKLMENPAFAAALDDVVWGRSYHNLDRDKSIKHFNGHDSALFDEIVKAFLSELQFEELNAGNMERNNKLGKSSVMQSKNGDFTVKKTVNKGTCSIVITTKDGLELKKKVEEEKTNHEEVEEEEIPIPQEFENGSVNTSKSKSKFNETPFTTSPNSARTVITEPQSARVTIEKKKENFINYNTVHNLLGSKEIQRPYFFPLSPRSPRSPCVTEPSKDGDSLPEGSFHPPLSSKRSKSRTKPSGNTSIKTMLDSPPKKVMCGLPSIEDEINPTNMVNPTNITTPSSISFGYKPTLKSARNAFFPNAKGDQIQEKINAGKNSTTWDLNSNPNKYSNSKGF